jgi:hypothetical protein
MCHVSCVMFLPYCRIPVVIQASYDMRRRSYSRLCRMHCIVTDKHKRVADICISCDMYRLSVISMCHVCPVSYAMCHMSSVSCMMTLPYQVSCHVP